MKKSIAVLLAFCVLLSGVTVFGAGVVMTAEENAETFQVDVNVTGLEALATVAVVAALEGTDPEIVAADGSSVYIGQEIADSSGSITTSIGFRQDAASGDYVIYLIDERTGERWNSAPFVYRSKSQVENAFAAVNSATAENMAEVLEQYGSDLLLDMTEYNAMGAAQQTVIRLFCQERPSGGFLESADMQIAFNRAVVTVAVTGAAEPEALLRKYAGNLGIDITALDECEAEGKAYALSLLTSKSYDAPEKLAAQYEEAVFAGMLYGVKTAGELQAYYLNRYTDVLNLDLTAYYKLKNPTKVFAALLGAPVTGYQDAADRFAQAVADQTRSESQVDSNRGNGGSGGGSTSGRGGYPAVAAQDVEKPVATPVPEAVYTDLEDAAWAREYILYLNERGIISGDGDGTFRPNDTITRAEFLKLVLEAFEIQDTPAAMTFEDVKPEDWYSDYVGIAAQAGLVNGISETWFGADDHITREDLTVMCSRALEYLGLSLTGEAELTPVDTQEISDYARDAVLLFYRAGIVNGDTDGRFHPKSSATRAEAAKIIAELLQWKEAE